MLIEEGVTSEEFTFHRLETREDVEQDLDLMRSVFGRESGVDGLIGKLIERHPGMTLKNHYVVRHRGKVVAGLVMIPVKWSIGGIILKVAEMGCVATQPRYRRLGLIRGLVHEFHQDAREQGYDLCALAGIPYFYRQFGYEYAIPLDEETRIRLDQVPDYEARHVIRPLTGRDIPAAARLLELNQRKFYVHSVRDPGAWKMQEESGTESTDRFEGYAVEREGEVVAYLRIGEKLREKELVLREISDTEADVAGSILSFLKEAGSHRGLETLTARTSYLDPFTRHLVGLGAVRRMPPYAWQIRIVDYAKMFLKMKPLFEGRLAVSAYSHLSGALDFNFHRFMVRMTVENGLIRDIQHLDLDVNSPIGLNPIVFTQLLLGHRNREELEAIYPDIRIQASHKPLIDVLFPKLPSHIHINY